LYNILKHNNFTKITYFFEKYKIIKSCFFYFFIFILFYFILFIFLFFISLLTNKIIIYLFNESKKLNTTVLYIYIHLYSFIYLCLHA
ncbi:hypothetical protein, partial [Plasmodium yoelii yoelii]